LVVEPGLDSIPPQYEAGGNLGVVWDISGYYPGIRVERLNKTTRTLRIVAYVSNTSLDRYTLLN
jgi:hypothetical protein